ncbi:D-glycero-beta-D-manno-heptose-7-phosphate kinase [SAR86 cluster bacterium]|nr:D-glycero-beta-D-manno-heptose-7-phosphate kinase [SAR86 cluster bacterium]
MFEYSKKPKILVIGDLILDQYLWGHSSRISPEAPVPVIDITSKNFSLGGAGNVIRNLNSLGAKVEVVSVLSECSTSKKLKGLLKDLKIKTHLFTQKNHIASKKTRVFSSRSQVLRFDSEDKLDLSSSLEIKIINKISSKIKEFDCVIISDYGKGVISKNISKSIIKISNSFSIKVLVDPKGTDFIKYKDCYLLTPNKKEASEALKIDLEVKNNIKPALLKLKNDLKVNVPLITLGADGIAYYDRGVRILPTASKEVFDVTGAGDTVISALSFAIASGARLEEAIKFSNIAAGIAVGKIGTAEVSIQEISKFMLDQDSLSENEKISNIKNASNNGKKIVFTNGCFDIIHSGHIKYLEEAKNCGDILVVGINSDSSVKKLKGPDRPIINESDRVKVLSSIKHVDFVLVFNDETPLKLIKSIRPDVLVKGGDYKNKSIVGRSFAKETRTLSFIKNKSSSKIIKKIKKI